MTIELSGWGLPHAGHKFHYFEQGMSLCRKWGFFRGSLEIDGEPSPDDCVACRRQLDLRAKRALAAGGDGELHA